MKKLKLTILFALLLTSINSSYAQLSPVEEDQVRVIVCEPIDDIFNLQCPRYQDEVDGNDYTDAINKAIVDAKNPLIIQTILRLELHIQKPRLSLQEKKILYHKCCTSMISHTYQ